MKKWITLFTITAVLCLLTACGLQPVSDNQKKTDLIQSAEVQNCYASKFAPQSEYVLKEYSLVKEQINKEDKEDIVFCNAVVENEHFWVSFQAQQLYNYYEKGGWIMDEITITNREVVPLKGPDNQLAADYVKGENLHEVYYNGRRFMFLSEDQWSFAAGDRESEYDAQSNVAKVYGEFKSPNHDIAGYYTMAFDYADEVWMLIPEGDREADELNAEEWIVDYTCALGTYTWQKGEIKGPFIDLSWPGGTITIKSITLEKVVYDLHITERKEDATVELLTGENLEAEFRPRNALFVVGVEGEEEAYVRYSVEHDRWYTSWTAKVSHITE